MGLIAAEKFKPVIFVGLGGNGGKIVNQLAGRLRRHIHWDRINDLTHFVVIDTNKDDLDKHRDIPPDCRFLISSFTHFARKSDCILRDTWSCFIMHTVSCLMLKIHC